MPTRVSPIESGRALDAMLVDDERAIEIGAKQGVATQNTTTTTMTNDTNYRGKANAVFFAAVMVVSMFAAGFAAAPAAAATSGQTTISYDAAGDGTSITEGTTGVEPAVTVSVDGGASDNFNSTNVGGENLSFIVDGVGVVETIDISSVNITPGGSSSFTFDGGDASSAIAGLDAGSYDHQVAVTDSNGDIVSDGSGDYSSGLVTLNVGDVTQGTNLPSELNTGESVSSGDIVVEVDNGPNSAEMTGVDVSVSLGSTSSSDSSGQTISADGTGVFNNFNNDLTAPLNSQSTNYTVTVSYSEGNDITFDVPVEVGDTGAGSASVTYQVDGNSQAIYYQGQDVNATDLESGTEYTLRQVDEFDGEDITSSGFEAEYTANESGFIDLDTSGLESGDYFLRGGDLAETRDNSFELTVQDFSAEWEEDSYDTGETEAELTTESQRNSYNVIISADGLDYDDLEALFAGDNSPVGDVAIDENSEDDEIIVEGFRDDQIIGNFSNASIDSGDYQFDLEVKDTEATDSASVTAASICRSTWSARTP